jgi:predicted short-subunit dehydrogenase-like oxidoreductase (DUF2520 family)
LNPTSKNRVALIGAGKVGTVLAAAVARAGASSGGGYSLTGIWDVSSAAIAASVRLLGAVPSATSAVDVAADASLVLIAVPDDILSGVVAALAAGRTDWRNHVFIHTSGRYGTAILEPLEVLGARTIAIHPAMAFAGDADADLARVAGARFAVTANSQAARDLGDSLVTDIGGVPLHIAESDRGLYHAALAHGSNHLVTLVVQAAEMLRMCAVESPAAVLQPLLEAALKNALLRGPAGATGPVVRGDVGTLLEHVETLSARLPDTLPAYCALTAAGIAIALAAGRITAAQAAQLNEALVHSQ